ncbi:MAG: hypothetical protein ACXVEF_00305 [Polyangiales bacterium]
MRKKNGPTPTWMERTGAVRPLRPVGTSCGLPTVAMLLALSTFGCQESATIAADPQSLVVQAKHLESASEDPPPGTGSLEAPPSDPEPIIESAIAKPRPKVTPKVLPPKPPVMLGGAPPPVTIVPTHPPASPKGGAVAVNPTI